MGIACCYSDLSMSQNGQTSIFETTAVQIISVGNFDRRFLKYGYWSNTMKYNEMDNV